MSQGAGHEAAQVNRAEAIARQLGAGDALEAVVEAVNELQPGVEPAQQQAGAALRAAKPSRRMGEGRAASPPPV